MFRVQNKLNCIFLEFILLKNKKKMIKPENYKRIKVKLVKCQNEDPRVINEKCMCQNGRKGIS